MNRNGNKRYGIFWYVGIFLLAVLLYTIVIFVEKAYPFGNRCFLADDAYVQYNTMLRTLIEYVHSSDKSAIMWNHGMGVDVYLNMLYYLLSPFNVIALILGESHVELALILIIVLKCSILPVTGLYYFRHTTIVGKEHGNNGLTAWIQFCCALAWGFCGYVVAYGQNIIWLDGLILVPLIAIAMEHVRCNKGYWIYTLLLAVSLIVNFYYAFYVCMFIVVYFILLEWNSVRSFFKEALKLLILSVISVLMAGIVLVPAACCIVKAGDTTLNNWSILDMWGDIGHYIVSFFPFKAVTNGYLYNSNSYCGTIVVLMLIAFVASSSVQLKQRIKYSCVVVFFMVASNFLPLNYALHGFVVTHGTGNRFAIILTFVLLMIVYRMLLNIDDIKVPAVIIIGVLGVVLLVLSFTDKSRLQATYSYIVFLLMLVITVMVLVLYARKSIKVKTAILYITILWMAEVCCNAVVTMSDKANDKDMLENIHLAEWEDEYGALDTNGVSRKTALINDNYVPDSDVNWYSSMINGYYVNAFSSMGLAHFDNVECVYDGATPFTALMYNVRYVLTNSRNTNGGYHLISENDIYNIYEADDLADWGFMTDNRIKEWSATGSVADNQSEFMRLGFGDELSELAEEKLMTIIPRGSINCDILNNLNILNSYSVKQTSKIEESFNIGEFYSDGIGNYVYTASSNQYMASVHLTFTADHDMELYVYSEDNRDQAVTVYIDNNNSAEVSYTSSGQLVYGGHIEKGQKVKVAVFGGASVGEKAEKHIQLYTFNTELFEKVKPYITDETLISDGYSGNSFRGHVTAKKNGVLYMAFPYSDGYTIYVDGQKAEKLLLGKGNMGVEVSAGYHDIELRYHTAGLIPGAIVSAVGVCAFVLLCIYDSRKRRNGALPDKG